MEYTTLGWSDEKVSRIGLGTWGSAYIGFGEPM